METCHAKRKNVLTVVLLCVAAVTGRATRPDEQSLHRVLERRAVQSAGSDWERAACRLLVPAMLTTADVELTDCGVWSVATVQFGQRRYRYLGVLGQWYRIR